jgi:hypothetical protein
VAVLAVSAAVAGLASPAGADVLVQATPSEPDAVLPAPTLVATDGTRRELATGRREFPSGFVLPLVSPDRRTVAGPRGRRIELVPTDGSAATVIGRTDLRDPAPYRSPTTDPGFGDDGSSGFFSTIGSPTVWWDADGSHVLRDAVRTAAGTPVVESCELATGRCTVRNSPRGLQRLGNTGDGGTLWTAAEPRRVQRYVGFGALSTERWVRATPGAVRRARAALRAPYRDQLLLVGPDGSHRTVWRSSRSFARGTTSLDASAPGPSGSIVGFDRTTYAVRTRTRKGRLEARLRTRTVARGHWRISSSGRRTSFRIRSAAGDGAVSVSAPAGPHGWYGGVADRRGRFVPVLVDDTGTATRITVAGRALTSPNLRAALGLPAAGGGRAAEAFSAVFASGFEAATDSLIVTSYDGAGGAGDGEDEEARQVVARVPLDGGAPSLIAFRPEPLARDSSLVQVTAW